MTIPDIRNEPCDCTDVCVKGCGSPSKCVNSLPGIVILSRCPTCSHGSNTALTWHQDGVCLCCSTSRIVAA